MVRSLAINYNNGILIAGSGDNSISVWKSNMSNKADEVDFTLQFRRENAHSNYIYSVAMMNVMSKGGSSDY